LKSGVHATLAGVLVALTIPLKGRDGEQSPLHRLEHDLHPWVAYLVLPLFAFANAGVSFTGLTVSSLTAPVTLGVALGLLFGKQLGVIAFTWLAVTLRLARLPSGVTWKQLYGVACLTGVGFTMSLFIGTLAFDTTEHLNQVRLGVLAGSIASGCAGYLVLRLAGDAKQAA
jgi:NhaA family Na+:H+ antiporter